MSGRWFLGECSLGPAKVTTPGGGLFGLRASKRTANIPPMSVTYPAPDLSAIHYPESDGKPMAENTTQYEWIVTIKGSLDALLDDFVVGDLFWYPVKGHPKIAFAPDVMVILGRPKGHRGSYRQWEEDDIAPQVVFEILSPSNSGREMLRKLEFYLLHGAEEFYVLDPDTNSMSGWQLRDGQATSILHMNGWISPRLGIKFTIDEDGMHVFNPDGTEMLSYQEQVDKVDAVQVLVDEANTKTDEANTRTDGANTRAEEAERRADLDKARADALASRLRELGVELSDL